MNRWLGKPKPSAQRIKPQATDAYTAFQARYYADPVGFARDCIAWPGGTELTLYQADILAAVPTHRRVSAVGPHGLGKSALSAILVLWYALTRDGRDWKAITTASVWRQLDEYLWPEIHKWARAIRWDKIGRSAFADNELLILSLNLRTGSAFAIASDKATALEGAHADHLLYLFDESKAVPDAVFDAAEGAFSTTGEIFAVAVSTPGDVAGRFYEIHTDRERFAEWWIRQVSLDECVAAGRVSLAWAEERRKQWGESSPVYINRVLGRFAFLDPEDGVIPRAWVKLAQERWRMIDEERQRGRRLIFIGYGVDVGGDSDSADATVIAPRYSPHFVDALVRLRGADTMQVAANVSERLRAQRGRAVVDVIGIGAGVVSRLRMLGYEVHGFDAGEGTEESDSTNTQRFENRRAWAWWHLRELLDPASGSDVALPPDQELEDDLCAPRYSFTVRSRILIERKDAIRARLGRSPDAGDAVVMAMIDVKPPRPPTKGAGRIATPLG